MSEPRETFVLAGLRSPFCKVDREHGRLDALQLSVPVVQQMVAGSHGPGKSRANEVDLVLWGSVIPTLAVSNWGREVWLDAGLDPRVPAQTVIQACGSSLAATTHAAAQIRTGHAELAICGGVESVTHTQVGLSKGLSRTLRRAASARGPAALIRTLGQLRPADLRVSIPGITERATGKTMGEHCEEMAKEWKIGREPQDRVALDSHQRSVEASERGFFRPLLTQAGTYRTDKDTIPRAHTSLERLNRLRPAFDRTRGTLTAGNSSPLTDGAAACWVASAEGAARLGRDLPRARLLDWEVAAIDLRHEGLLMAPALAIPRMLERHRLAYEQVEVWEIHEAFAAQVLCTLAALESKAWLTERAGVTREMGRFPVECMNLNGGSIAIGHPFAATGARILSQAVALLAERPAGTRAVVSICAAGGLGNVALIEAV